MWACLESAAYLCGVGVLLQLRGEVGERDIDIEGSEALDAPELLVVVTQAGRRGAVERRAHGAVQRPKCWEQLPVRMYL